MYEYFFIIVVRCFQLRLKRNCKSFGNVWHPNFLGIGVVMLYAKMIFYTAILTCLDPVLGLLTTHGLILL